MQLYGGVNEEYTPPGTVSFGGGGSLGFSLGSSLDQMAYPLQGQIATSVPINNTVVGPTINRTETYAPRVNATTNNITQNRIPTQIPGLPPLPQQIGNMAPMQFAPFQPYNPQYAPQYTAQNPYVAGATGSVAILPKPDPIGPIEMRPHPRIEIPAPEGIDQQLWNQFQDRQLPGQQSSVQPSVDSNPAAAPPPPQPAQQPPASYQQPQYYQPPQQMPAHAQRPTQPDMSGMTPPNFGDISQAIGVPYSHHPIMAGMLAGLGPRAQKMYTDRMTGANTMATKMFDIANENYREQMKQDTEMRKAAANQKVQGAMTYDQAQHRWDEIRRMDDKTPQDVMAKTRAIIHAQAAAETSGLNMDFSDLLNLPQDPKAATEQMSAVGNAIKATVDAHHAVQTAASKTAADTATNMRTVDEYADYGATRGAALNGKLAREQDAVNTAAKNSATYANDVAKSYLDVQNAQAGLGKTGVETQKLQQDVAAQPMQKASALVNTANQLIAPYVQTGRPIPADIQNQYNQYIEQSRRLNNQPTAPAPPDLGPEGQQLLQQAQAAGKNATPQQQQLLQAYAGYNQHAAKPQNMPNFGSVQNYMNAVQGQPTQQGFVNPPQSPHQFNVPPPPPGGMNVPPQAVQLPQPAQQGAVLKNPADVAKFVAFARAQGGDENMARQIAQQYGWQIPTVAPQAVQQAQQQGQGVPVPAPKATGPNFFDQLGTALSAGAKAFTDINNRNNAEQVRKYRANQNISETTISPQLDQQLKSTLSPQAAGLQRGATLTDPAIKEQLVKLADGDARQFNALVHYSGWGDVDWQSRNAQITRSRGQLGAVPPGMKLTPYGMPTLGILGGQ